MVSGFLTSPCDHSRIFSGAGERDANRAERERILGLLEEAENVAHWIISGRIRGRAHVVRSLSAASVAGRLDQLDVQTRAWSSLMSTLKLSGRPGSSVYSPLTIASYMRVRPMTSSLLTVRNSWSA